MNTKDQKDASHNPKRKYRGTVQAEVAALTRQRVLQAALELFDEQWGDQITLPQIADRAGVSVQTILRQFGSKDQLADAVSEEAYRRALELRSEPPADGNLASIVAGLMTYYEAGGERMLRGMAQEARQPHLHAIIDRARASHREWLERTFARVLPQADADRRRVLLAELFTLTSVAVWHYLRNECGLSREETAQALYEMIEKLV